MYSDGQNANFIGQSLDKYRIVFNQTLQHPLIYRYVTHLGRKPSKTITIKTYRKMLFHTKRENSKGCSHEILKFLKILLFFRNDVNWSDKIRNHGRTLPDCVFHEILQNSHMELKYDFNDGEWKRNQISNLKRY
ncbi:hypothetical protein T11_15741 [Trichinella zimbabwensis]|uniref:Uncharacterized protein n=1 Tax=Trichinella zimbabwensis TaxID=268475 RepID=A0A0V1H5H2_9BILA|nr:hypothetical protein T11_15741 [Trichinella zimbabwensis]